MFCCCGSTIRPKSSSSEPSSPRRMQRDSDHTSPRQNTPSLCRKAAPAEPSISNSPPALVKDFFGGTPKRDTRDGRAPQKICDTPATQDFLSPHVRGAPAEMAQPSAKRRGLETLGRIRVPACGVGRPCRTRLFSPGAADGVQTTLVNRKYFELATSCG